MTKHPEQTRLETDINLAIHEARETTCAKCICKNGCTEMLDPMSDVILRHHYDAQHQTQPYPYSYLSES